MSSISNKHLSKSGQSTFASEELTLVEEKKTSKFREYNIKLNLNNKSINQDLCQKEDQETNEKIYSNYFEIDKNYNNSNDKSSILENEILDDQNEIKIMEIIDNALKCKIQGNLMFKQRSYEESISAYIKALEMLKIDNKLVSGSNLQSIRIECLSNISLCYYIMRNYKESLKITETVMQIQKNNVRNLYIRAKSLRQLNRLNESHSTLKYALTLNNNSSIIKELNELEYLYNNDRTKIEETNSSKDDETEDSIINVPNSSSILVKLFKVFTYKILEVIKKEKSLMFLLSIILFFFVKNQFKLNFNNFSKIVSFMK